MPDHNWPRLWPTKDDARVRRLLIAHANSGTLEEPAETATRSSRKAAQMLAIRCSFHAADNEAANARFQCGARLEPSTRCRIAERIIATFRCRNRSIRLLRHIRLWTHGHRTNGVLMSPAFTSSIALAMAITPTLAAAQSMPDESLTERNKAVVRAYLDEIAQRGSMVAREQYFKSTTTFNGDPDLARQLARIVEIRRAFPDLEMTIEQQIAEGPWVATRVTYRGTHAREFAGIPATGRRIEYAGTAMDRLENGKVVEMWHTVNMHLLMRQIAGDGSAPQKP